MVRKNLNFAGFRRGEVVGIEPNQWVAVRSTREQPGPNARDWQPVSIQDDSLIIPGPPGESVKGDKGDQGDSIKGDKGDPGDSVKGDKGDPGIIWRGLWSRRVTYNPGHAVSWNGSSYVANRETRREPSPQSNAWDLLARAGDKGEPGKNETTVIRHGSPRIVQALARLDEIESQIGESGSGIAPIPAIFDSTALSGMAIYLPSDGHADLASNDAETAIGICFADVSASAAGQFITEGEVSRDDWTAVAGTTDLVPSATYYLATTGQISATPPNTVGLRVQPVGFAVSKRTLSVEISTEPILL